jgi:hypothetical protein
MLSGNTIQSHTVAVCLTTVKVAEHSFLSLKSWLLGQWSCWSPKGSKTKPNTVGLLD